MPPLAKPRDQVGAHQEVGLLHGFHTLVFPWCKRMPANSEQTLRQRVINHLNPVPGGRARTTSSKKPRTALHAREWLQPPPKQKRHQRVALLASFSLCDCAFFDPRHPTNCTRKGWRN